MQIAVNVFKSQFVQTADSFRNSVNGSLYGCIQKLKNAAFGGIPRQEGIKANLNPKLASLPVSRDTFFW